ncbi:MAG TPA: ParA family protein [Ktedonobacterales bacterium]|nr:ParA family protein [Ktedonobacterales bacterium]
MTSVYGVAIRKGGQGKSTTVSTLGRLCAIYGARVLIVDLAQPGTTTASLRDIWAASEHDALSNLLLAFRAFPAGVGPSPAQALAAFAAARLPVRLPTQPSWSGGSIAVLPWDDALGDASAFLQSERILAGLIAGLADEFDIALIDYPGEGGPLLSNATAATNCVIMPLTPETPALEGADAMLRLLARMREAGQDIRLGGILLTRCDPKNKRMYDVAQTIRQVEEVEGMSLDDKLFPFAIRNNEFFEQAFRYGEPIWERSSNPAHWAGYVLLTEWALRDAGLGHLSGQRRGPALLTPDTRILDATALLMNDPDIPLADFERAHPTG